LYFVKVLLYTCMFWIYTLPFYLKFISFANAKKVCYCFLFLAQSLILSVSNFLVLIWSWIILMCWQLWCRWKSSLWPKMETKSSWRLRAQTQYSVWRRELLTSKICKCTSRICCLVVGHYMTARPLPTTISKMSLSSTSSSASRETRWPPYWRYS